MVKILLMRHAQSMFNLRMTLIKNKYDIKGTILAQKDKFDTFPKEFWSELKVFFRSEDPEVVNAILTEEGVNQCNKTASTTLKDKYTGIKHALVSPFRRTIQTFEHTFHGYANEKNLNIELNELLRETSCAPCDVCCWTDEELATINKDRFDWTWMHSKPEPHFWFFEQLDEEHKKKAYDLFKGKEGLSVEEKRSILLEDMVSEENFPLQWEKEKSKVERALAAKEMLSKKVKSENIQDYELIVVTHYDTLRMFTAKSFDENYNPSGYIEFDNAEIREFEI